MVNCSSVNTEWHTLWKGGPLAKIWLFSNGWQLAENTPTQTLFMARPPSFLLPCISWMASKLCWATAHLNMSHVLNYTPGSLNRGQSTHPTHWRAFQSTAPSHPLQSGRLWPNAQISSSLGGKHIRKEASAWGIVLFWWKGHSFHHIWKPIFKNLTHIQNSVWEAGKNKHWVTSPLWFKKSFSHHGYPLQGLGFGKRAKLKGQTYKKEK